METRLTLIHAISPLHAGTGQSVGAIDLPIARERPTGIPLIPGSSIKGSLRARSQGRDAQMTRDVFGPDTASSSDHAGSVQFSDAHLLLLPVRSIRGTFAWITSPYLIRKFTRSAEEVGLHLPQPTGLLDMAKCCVLENTLTIPGSTPPKVVLEDLDFIAEPTQKEPLKAFAEALGKILFPEGSSDFQGWRKTLGERICLVHDDVMSFLLDTATEVNAHIRLNNEAKTVERGGLWYQESLPAETVLAGLVVTATVKAVNGRSERQGTELINHIVSLTDGLVQLGGKATTGQGSCFVRIGGRP